MTRPPGDGDLSHLLSTGSGNLARIAEEPRTLEENLSNAPTNYVPVISQPSGHGGFQSEDQSGASVVESTHVGSSDTPGISDYMEFHAGLTTDQSAESRGDRRVRVNVRDVPVLERREAQVVTLP